MTALALAFVSAFAVVTAGVWLWPVVDRLAWWDAWMDAMLAEV